MIIAQPRIPTGLVVIRNRTAKVRAKGSGTRFKQIITKYSMATFRDPDKQGSGWEEPLGIDPRLAGPKYFTFHPDPRNEYPLFGPDTAWFRNQSTMPNPNGWLGSIHVKTRVTHLGLNPSCVHVFSFGTEGNPPDSWETEYQHLRAWSPNHSMNIHTHHGHRKDTLSTRTS